MKGLAMTKTFVLLAALAISAHSSQASPVRTRLKVNSVQEIVIYTGLVDANSAKRLTAIVANNTDKVIGLKLTVAKSKDSDKRFYSDLSGNQLNITSGDPSDGSMEVVINKVLGKTMAGMFYTVDGFYLIKSGGSHAGGALSYGALPVDEATIRLNPKIRLISRKF